MEEIKKLHNEKLKETQELANNSTVGTFLLKTHEETFQNLDLVAHDMATIPIKRYMMLSAESDGIELILKFGGDKLQQDEEFKLFIKKMNEYLKKIREDVAYEEVEEYKENETRVYDKFRSLGERFS
jgi:hypothetical protein